MCVIITTILTICFFIGNIKEKLMPFVFINLLICQILNCNEKLLLKDIAFYVVLENLCVKTYISVYK